MDLLAGRPPLRTQAFGRYKLTGQIFVCSAMTASVYRKRNHHHFRFTDPAVSTEAVTGTAICWRR